MNKMTFHFGGSTFTRISKAKARNLWGKSDMAFCPCNLRPGFLWFPHTTFFATQIAEKLIKFPEVANFDKRVGTFEWFNCSDSETGLYTSFYLLTHK